MLLVLLLSCAVAFPNLATSRLLTDYVESHGARCLDGTPQRYWIQESQSTVNVSKWYIHIMGGGWCESLLSCAYRAYSPTCYIGSSNEICFTNAPGDEIPGVNFTEVMDWRDIPSCLNARWCGGLMNNDSSTNPLTWDWNKVLIPYCDGGSFAGNREDVVTTQYNNETVELYFRGWRNLNAVLDDLVTRNALDQASYLILGGDSAGGLATWWHIDHVASLLPNTQVFGAPDSSFFLYDATFPTWGSELEWVVSFMNSTAGLDQSCIQAMNSSGKDPLECRFPEVTAPYVETPMFIMQSQYDPVLDIISSGENGDNITNVNRIGQLVQDTILDVAYYGTKNALFLTSCHEHCGQWAQGQVLGPNGEFNDFNTTIDDTQAVFALQEWFYGGQRSLWIQVADYPCDSCCAGGDPQ